jgi:hypothetical protein
MPGIPDDCGSCVDAKLFRLFAALGVIGRTDFDDITSGDSRFDRESTVRGDAAGDGTAGGKYGLWCRLL